MDSVTGGTKGRGIYRKVDYYSVISQPMISPMTTP